MRERGPPDAQILALAGAGEGGSPWLTVARLLTAALRRIAALERTRFVTGLRIEPDGSVFAIRDDGTETRAGKVAIEAAAPRAMKRVVTHERDPGSNQILRSIVTETMEEN